jgi:hypothetical protein
MEPKDLKTLIHPETGEKFKMGRKQSIAPQPHLRLSNYLMRTVPPPPPARSDYAHPAIPGLQNILGNDQYGDCVFAGAMHIEDIFRGNTGSTQFATEQQALWLYSRVTGFNPNDPNSDAGGDLQTNLNWWRSHGLFADGSAKCAGWMAVNLEDEVEVKTALWLFGNLYLGFMLPDGWVNPMPAHNSFTWDVAGDPIIENGHCIAAYGYNAQGIFVNTWGMFGTITWAALKKYGSQPNGGEGYTVLSYDWVNKTTSLAPSGFSFAQLQADLYAIT